MNTKFDEILIMCTPACKVGGELQYTVCLSTTCSERKKALFSMPGMDLVDPTDELPNPIGFGEEDINDLRNFITDNKSEIDDIAMEEAEEGPLFFEVPEEMVLESGDEFIEEMGFTPVFNIQKESSSNSQLSVENMSNASGVSGSAVI